MSATGLVGIDVNESHGVDRNALQSSYFLVCEDNRSFLSGIPTDSINLVVTSPPHNLVKDYETRLCVKDHVELQSQEIRARIRVFQAF